MGTMHLLLLLCLSPPRRIGENQLIVKVAQQIAHWRGGERERERGKENCFMMASSSVIFFHFPRGGGKRKENFFMMSLSSVIVVLSGVGGGKGDRNSLLLFISRRRNHVSASKDT